jgi:DNA uptake protein ComE-like DNA-binding protein
VSFLVDLNSAPLADLVALPRIGEATAAKLIAARPLASLEDARKVAGMSDGRWAEVTPLVQVAHHTQVRP